MGCCVTQPLEFQPPSDPFKVPANKKDKKRNGSVTNTWNVLQIQKRKINIEMERVTNTETDPIKTQTDDNYHDDEEQLALKLHIEQEERRIQEERIKQQRIERERREKEEKERKERERKIQKRARIRTNAMKELLTTEQTYVGLLKECIEVFVDPLLNNGQLVDKIENAHRILFSDIKIIYGVNIAFLDDLSLKFKEWDNCTTKIGDDFAKFTPYFRAYQSYLNNYDAAAVLLNRLTDIERNKYIAFNEWYDGQRSKYCDNKSLDFYLILPIQRLPRYKLCLTEIIKNTESDHCDLNDLNVALKAITDVTMVCNDRMKEFESRCIVRDIEIQFVSYSKVDTKLVTPSRRFVKKGRLWRLTRKGDSHKLVFYLFNDLLCYASESIAAPLRKLTSTVSADSNNNVSDRSAMRLQMRLVIDDIFHVCDVGEDKYNGRAFEIHSAVKSIIVYAESVKEKAEWLLEITQCIDNVQNGIKYNGKTQYELSAAVWIPDDWSDCCMVSDCKRKFNSITTRRHHCRWCGKLICRECGKYKLRHKIRINNMVSPVCADCYHMNHKRYRANTGAQLYYDDEEEDEQIPLQIKK